MKRLGFCALLFGALVSVIAAQSRTGMRADAAAGSRSARRIWMSDIEHRTFARSTAGAGRTRGRPEPSAADAQRAGSRAGSRSGGSVRCMSGCSGAGVVDVPGAAGGVSPGAAVGAGAAAGAPPPAGPAPRPRAGGVADTADKLSSVPPPVTDVVYSFQISWTLVGSGIWFGG